MISDKQAETIKQLIDEIGTEYGSVTGLYKGFFKKFGIEKLGDLSVSEYDNAIAALEMKRKKK